MVYQFLLFIGLTGIFISCKGNDSKEYNLVNNITVNKEKIFSETWRWKSEDKSQEFTLKILEITNDSLFAQYCAVYNYGQKLDCDFEKNINIKAAFNRGENAYVGDFHSFFNSGKGKCLIKVTDQALSWSILKIPDGEYYAPDTCILKKESSILIKKEKGSAVGTVHLPFDYENYKQTCIQSSSADCQEKYPLLNTSEYDKIIKILDRNEGRPQAIFPIQSIFNSDIAVYVLNFEGDSSLQEIVTVKNNKIVSSQSIGYAMPDEETYETFIINSDMTIDVYEISFADHLNKKKKGKYKLSAHGNIEEMSLY
ncbi:hypothetical protein [Chryseobacterium pennipullorum]|uniref:Uncharacterized protein n=1 Tax=Chryseobacterium pennipullorum TaxID=2258963 RepID=A0A3D9B912_9FLAO|nr:hypothetical protein [Chryseobacterium pennipullorum]REC50181.1 hypothetical protein DRF67_01200 [Chryseobacterium pennipullorum]